MSKRCCYGCTRRYVGCHSDCPDYKELQEENKRCKKNEIEYKLRNSRTPVKAQVPNKNKRGGRWKDGTN